MCPCKTEAEGVLSQAEKEKTDTEGRVMWLQAKEDQGMPAVWKLEEAGNGFPPRASGRRVALPTP